jgi:uncharacterized protein
MSDRIDRIDKFYRGRGKIEGKPLRSESRPGVRKDRGKWMETKQPKIKIPKDRIAAFCRRHHIRRLSLFGSALRDDFGPDSDVDVLVEFEPGKTPSFFKLFDMEDELSAILEGRKVDVRTPEDLGRYFRQRVLSQALVQYAA